MATMTHEEVEEKMLDMLEEVCGDEEVRDHRDEDLFELGFLDSMAAVELLVDIGTNSAFRLLLPKLSEKR